MENTNKIDSAALYNIGYGLYVVTSHDGERDNGLIVNSINQVTNTPSRVAVTIDKKNYSHDIIARTGIMNVNCLSEDAPFSVFENFGFKSGKDTDKFKGISAERTKNGLVILPQYINSVISLKVEQYVDLDTHGMFICSVEEAHVISSVDTMTYTYYHKRVKPQPQAKKGFVCKICGFIYDGDVPPDDYICPLCKHPASDFEPIE